MLLNFDIHTIFESDESGMFIFPATCLTPKYSGMLEVCSGCRKPGYLGCVLSLAALTLMPAARVASHDSPASLLFAREAFTDRMLRPVSQLNVTVLAWHRCTDVSVYVYLNALMRRTCNCEQVRVNLTPPATSVTGARGEPGVCMTHRQSSGIALPSDGRPFSLITMLDACYQAVTYCRVSANSTQTRMVRHIWHVAGVSVDDWTVPVSTSISPSSVVSSDEPQASLASLLVDLGVLCDTEAGIVSECSRGHLSVSLFRWRHNQQGRRYLEALGVRVTALPVQPHLPENSPLARHLRLVYEPPDYHLTPGLYSLRVFLHDLRQLCSHRLPCPDHWHHFNISTVSSSLARLSRVRVAAEQGVGWPLLATGFLLLLGAVACLLVLLARHRRRHVTWQQDEARVEPVSGQRSRDSIVLLVHSGRYCDVSTAVKEVAMWLRAAGVRSVDVQSAGVRNQLISAPPLSLFSSSQPLSVVVFVCEAGRDGGRQEVAEEEGGAASMGESLFCSLLEWLSHSSLSSDCSRLYVVHVPVDRGGEEERAACLCCCLVPGCRYWWPEHRVLLLDHVCVDHSDPGRDVCQALLSTTRVPGDRLGDVEEMKSTR